MYIPFDDLPEGDVQSRRRELRERMGHPWIYYGDTNYDITADYPSPKSETKHGKALRISKLSKTCNNYSFLVFEGYEKRYVFVEFDVYIPNEMPPFYVGLTYLSTFNHSNRGPAVWYVHKPGKKKVFQFLPHKGDKAVTQREYSLKVDAWTRFRVMTDMKDKTVTLWAGPPGETLRLIRKNAKFNVHSPIFCNAIYLRMDANYTDKYIYMDNIMVYEKDNRKVR
ncbi:MAG: hypothetical protein JXA11_00930 [Phycisphaerae bacterium]|nr:hypothetical protein [Phycisphaerae bacterium]